MSVDACVQRISTLHCVLTAFNAYIRNTCQFTSFKVDQIVLQFLSTSPTGAFCTAGCHQYLFISCWLDGHKLIVSGDVVIHSSQSSADMSTTWSNRLIDEVAEVVCA